MNTPSLINQSLSSLQNPSLLPLQWHLKGGGGKRAMPPPEGLPFCPSS